MATILLIDDCESATFYEDLTETYHFNVHWVKNADQALKIIDVHQFDAIILDYMMPVPHTWSSAKTG